MKIIVIKEEVNRSIDAIKCECGGYAERVSSSQEEIDEYGCGRDRFGDECCARTFLCCVCGARLVGCAESPDCEW